MKAKDKNVTSSFAWPKDFFLFGGAFAILILLCGNLYALFSTGVYNASMALEIAVIFALIINTGYFKNRMGKFFINQEKLLDDANRFSRISAPARWFFVIGAFFIVSGVVSNFLPLFGVNLNELKHLSNMFFCAGVFLILVPGMLFFYEFIRSLTRR